MKGFVSVHRKLMNNAVWSDPNYLKLWLYCLFEASHQDREQLIGNQKIEIERGQFPTGRFSLSDAMNKGVKPKQRLTDRTWWRHLENLEKWGMLTIKTTNKYSVVTIVNYDIYQYKQKEDDQQIDQQLSIKSPTDATNNNVNNGNNDNKRIPYAAIVDHLNEKTGKNYKPSARKTRELIQARWNEGYSLEDFIKVIDVCSQKWKGKTFSNGVYGDEYLRPSTLFNGKFDERLNWSLDDEKKVTMLDEWKSDSIKPDKSLFKISGGR